MYQIKATVTKNWQEPMTIELMSKRKMTEAQLKAKFANEKDLINTSFRIKNKVTINDFSCRKVA